MSMPNEVNDKNKRIAIGVISVILGLVLIITGAVMSSGGGSADRDLGALSTGYSRYYKDLKPDKDYTLQLSTSYGDHGMCYLFVDGAYLSDVLNDGSDVSVSLLASYEDYDNYYSYDHCYKFPVSSYSLYELTFEALESEMEVYCYINTNTDAYVAGPDY